MMSFIIVLTLFLIATYAALSWHVYRQWQYAKSDKRNLRREHILLAVVLLLHGYAVLAPFAEGALVSIGVGRALAVVTWLMLLMYWVCHYHVEGLQLFMMPLAVLTLAFALLFPGHHVVHHLTAPAFLFHILVSMLAYSLFAIGALFAVLMLVLERALHNKHHPPLVRQLPPLLSLERTMFQVLSIGFVLLTLSLLSGILFSEQVFGQPAEFTHKTFFSGASWLIFAALLFGRGRYGWRGRVAVHWALAGFAALMLAYLGSKVVLELILRRP